MTLSTETDTQRIAHKGSVKDYRNLNFRLSCTRLNEYVYTKQIAGNGSSSACGTAIELIEAIRGNRYMTSSVNLQDKILNIRI